MNIRIVQLLCPSRHIGLAAAYESPDGAADPLADFALRQLQGELIGEGDVQPRCGICGSRELTVEDELSEFVTYQDAEHGIGQRMAWQEMVYEAKRGRRN